MTNLNLIIFNISKELQVIAELNKHYSQQENFDVEFIVNPAKVSQFIQTTGNGIIMFKVASKSDLQAAVYFLKTHKRAIKKGLVKPACILMVKNKKVEKILAKYGCQELLDDNINSKTLRYKVDFWARNLKSQIEKIEKEKANRLKAKSIGAASKNEEEDTKKQEFVSTPAIELHSDTWLIKNKSDAKKILKRYLIRVLGPSPHIGQWFELEPQPGDSMLTWKYVLKHKDEQQFVVDEGAWYFSGSKPEFDWKSNRWNFSSDAPHLYFYTTQGEVFSRFKFKGGKVEVAENSNYALTKEEMILETCDTNFNFDAGKVAKEEEAKLDGENDGNDVIDKNFEGKTDGEDIRDGLLSAKNKDGSIDELGGSLSGKVNKNSEDEDEEAQAKKKGSFEDDQAGHYGGKGSTDVIEDGPLSGKLKPGQVKAKEDSQKDREGFAEDDQGGHYGGRGSTDVIEDGPLSGTLKPGQVKAKDEKDREGFAEDDQGGHYGGKGSTDKIEDAPLSGKLKPGQVKAKEDKDREGFAEGDIGGYYGGEGSTNQIDADPLSGKLKPTEQAKKENRKSKFEEEDQGGHYDNEGSTDEVDRSPLKGKLKAKDPFAQGDDLDNDDDMIAPKKKKSIERSPINQDDNEREIDEPQPSQVRAEESHPDEVAARDGVTEFEKNNPELVDPKRKGENYDVDELDRDALEKLKKKQEALKKAGLSDEDLSIDELDRDGLDKIMKKRQEALKAAELLEEGDDVNDLAKPEPETIKAIKEKSPLAARKETDDFSVDELERDRIEKLKKKHEALKKAGLSDEDLSVDELDRDGLDALVKKRQAALKEAGLLEEDDDVNALAKVTRQKVHNPRTGVEEDQAKVDAMIDGNSTEELSSKKAKEMAEALDAVASNVTDIKDAIIDNKAKEADTLDPNQIIDNSASSEELKEIFEKEIPVSTESGELNVVIESPEENVAHVCKFEDFYTTEIVVVIEAGKLSQEQTYEVKVNLKYAGSKIEIKQNAKVIEVDDLEDGKVLVCLEFIQEIDEKEYNTFSTLYQERQESISDFMNLARGYYIEDEG